MNLRDQGENKLCWSYYKGNEIEIWEIETGLQFLHTVDQNCYLSCTLKSKLLLSYCGVKNTLVTEASGIFHWKNGLWYLFGELLLTQFIQGEELPGQLDVVDEATAGQFHPDDDLPIRNHHGYWAEVDLQVLWEFLTARVPRVLNTIWTMTNILSFKVHNLDINYIQSICRHPRFYIEPYNNGFPFQKSFSIGFQLP